MRLSLCFYKTLTFQKHLSNNSRLKYAYYVTMIERNYAMTKILVCEDEKDLNRFVCLSLRNAGYDATAAFDGKDALDKLETEQFDLVLTDIMMPNMDGYELCQSVRALSKELPIIFMTAKDDKLSKLTGYSLGVDDYVVKPFDMDILLMKISAILRRSQIRNSKSLTVGNLTMNTEERSATVDGAEIPLTVREFDLLFKLLSYPKKTFTRAASSGFKKEPLLGSKGVKQAFSISK